MSCPNCDGYILYSGRWCTGTCVTCSYCYMEEPWDNEITILDKGKPVVKCSHCGDKTIIFKSEKYLVIDEKTYIEGCYPYIQQKTNKRMKEFPCDVCQKPCHFYDHNSPLPKFCSVNCFELHPNCVSGEQLLNAIVNKSQ